MVKVRGNTDIFTFLSIISVVYFFFFIPISEERLDKDV